jgi:hypothetical protein
MKDMFRCENLMVSVLIVALLLISGYQIKVAFSQDEEAPNFGTEKAPFIPLPEENRNPPPPPKNATIVKDLPKNMFVRDNDTDTEPLSITNKTEILEVLPANSTTAIDFVDKSLKNSTGQGLLPPSVLSNISKTVQLENISKLSNENQTGDTLLDVLNQENLTQKILPLIEPLNKSATSSDLEELEEPLPPKVSKNATTLEEEEQNQTSPSSVNKNVTEENENQTSQENSLETAQPEINQSTESAPGAKDLGSQVSQIQNNTQNEEDEEKPSINVKTNNTQNEEDEEKPSINVKTNNTQNEEDEEKPSTALAKNQQNEEDEEKPSTALAKNQQNEEDEEKPPINVKTNNTQNEEDEEKPPFNLTTNNTQND